jgi:hypothetical protein
MVARAGLHSAPQACKNQVRPGVARFHLGWQALAGIGRRWQTLNSYWQSAKHEATRTHLRPVCDAAVAGEMPASLSVLPSLLGRLHLVPRPAQKWMDCIFRPPNQRAAHQISHGKRRMRFVVKPCPSPFTATHPTDLISTLRGSSPPITPTHTQSG